MSEVEFKNRLREIYEKTMAENVDKKAESLSIESFFNQYEIFPNWIIGPMKKEPSLTFKKMKQWSDPTATEWKSGFLFNPSLIEKDGKLFMFYRASPKIETLCSRIGMSVYTDDLGWQDYQNNPVVFPIEDDEEYGTEDPKVYKVNDKYVLFYHGVSPVTEDIRANLQENGFEVPDQVCTIKAMISDDLYHWERLGQIVPTEVSHYWAKGAVIPRNPRGEAVKINGEYLMYLSEGCGGKQVIGHSADMINWTFSQQDYLNIDEIGSICEVACAVTDYSKNEDDLLLDVFYRKQDGSYAGLQVLYSKQVPFTQIEMNHGATLSWGGLIKYNGSWICAQGWDAEAGSEEMYLYTAEDVK